MGTAKSREPVKTDKKPAAPAEPAMEVTPEEPPVEPEPVAEVKAPPAAPATVRVDSLRPGTKFEFNGVLYQAGIMDEGVLKVLNLHQPALGVQVLHPDAQVKPI